MNFLRKIFSGIRGRVLRSFFLIIVFFAVYGLVSSYLLMKNKSATETINDVNQPSITRLTELELVLVQASNLTIKWIKTDIEDHVDKKRMKEIHAKVYPDIKNNISKLSNRWNDKSQIDSLKLLISKIDSNFKKQAEIMTTLAKFENYDGVTNLLAESDGDAVVSDINKQTERLHAILNKLKTDTSNQQEEMIKNMETLTGTNILLLIIIIIAGFILTFRLSNQIIKPVHSLQGLVEKVSKGELEDLKIKPTKDEIGHMLVSVQHMIGGLQTTAFFANEIGKGNLETDFSPLSEKDVLGNALITMRSNLVKVAKEDRQRNWANEGYATFGEILRSHHENMSDMLDLFLSKLVKYVDANQGWLYLINDTNEEEEEHLELKSVYAFDRKKFLNKKIYKGEGLAGQVWIEGELIHLTDIPKNYVSITSGLGDATPSSVVIVPLKVNDNINGIIEFASFHEFQNYQIEFIQKLSENLSSTLSTLKINVKTKHLLEESQKQRYQMHEQEEEMRQNLEELQATQEEMERKQEDTDLLLTELRERENELSVENQELRDELIRLKSNLAEEEN